jgi:hypothetical protein
MEPSSIFLTGPLAAQRSADLQLAWVDAADDVHDAYAGWLRAERAERINAFTAYQAALDREGGRSACAGATVTRRQCLAQIKLSSRAREIASVLCATPSLR